LGRVQEVMRQATAGGNVLKKKWRMESGMVICTKRQVSNKVRSELWKKGGGGIRASK